VPSFCFFYFDNSCHVAQATLELKGLDGPLTISSSKLARTWDWHAPPCPVVSVRFKLFNEARIDEKENKLTSTDWMGLY
jgi:hypothetical protein